MAAEEAIPISVDDLNMVQEHYEREVGQGGDIKLMDPKEALIKEALIQEVRLLEEIRRSLEQNEGNGLRGWVRKTLDNLQL